MTSGLTDRARPAAPIVGIIGGMGPAATVDLMSRIIAKTPAEDDADHIHLIVESNPKIASRLAHLVHGTGPDPTPELQRIAANLERAGADVLAMPCNTAHAYAADIRHAVRIPLLDMVELSVAHLARQTPGARVGLLATSAVHRIGLYDKSLTRRGLIPVVPDQQDLVMQIIQGVKRGEMGDSTRVLLKALSQKFRQEVDVLLIACTELSALSGSIDAPFVDASDVLADAILRFAGVTPNPFQE